MMGLSENRAQHCRNVANLMRAWAPLLNLDAEEIWLLGWLHDIGYTLGDNEHHAHLGGELLWRLGYAHWQIVYNHGTAAGLTGGLGVLLNLADMSIDSAGSRCGFSGRLADVADRYGSDSVQIKKCEDVVGRLIKTPEYEILQSTTEL